jgi:uncharacterized SAM-dependent methyltransferase
MSDEIATDFISKLSDNKKRRQTIFRVDLIKPRPLYFLPTAIAKGLQLILILICWTNKELEANFDLEFFEHQPEYKESEGIKRVI